MGQTHIIVMTILTVSFSFILESLILGILASLIVAVVVELWKKRIKKYHVSAVLESSELYVHQDKSDVHIKVDYKGTSIENTLVIINVSLVNDGKNDIMFRTHFSDDIKISSEGYRILSISARNDDVKPECKLEDDVAELSWDILKAGESISLRIAAQSVAPVSKTIDSVECFNNLSFEFRSDCLDGISPSHELTNHETNRRHLLNNSLLKYACILVISLFFFLFDMSFSSRFDVVYEGQTYQNATLLYSPLFKKYVLSSDSAATKVLSPEDLDCVNSVIPADAINAANKISYLLELMIMFMLVMSILSIILNRMAYRKLKKIA